VEQLIRDSAELALRLAAIPIDRLRNDVVALDAIEQLALRVLKEVSAVRTGRNPVVGEISGKWRAMQPAERR
jgi:hypothetical protein